MTTATATEPRWVGLDVVAVELDIPERTLRHLAANGDLPVPAVKVGRRWRVSRTALDELAARTIPAATHPADFT